MGIPFKDLQNLVLHVQVGHAFSVVVILVNIVETQVLADCLADLSHSIGKVHVLYDVLDVRVVLVLLEPVVLLEAELRRISPEEVASLPGTHISLFDVNGEGMEGPRSREYWSYFSYKSYLILC